MRPSPNTPVQLVRGGPALTPKCGSRKEKHLGSATTQLGQRKDHKQAKNIEAKWGRGKGQMPTPKQGRGGGIYPLNETSACVLPCLNDFEIME